MLAAALERANIKQQHYPKGAPPQFKVYPGERPTAILSMTKPNYTTELITTPERRIAWAARAAFCKATRNSMRLRVLILIAGLVATVVAEPCLAETITVSGQIRTYLLARPSASGPQPTIILLHGGGADGAHTATKTGLNQTGPGLGFVIAFPNAMNGVWNLFPDGEAESLLAEQRSHGAPTGDDVAFIMALVADLVGRGISDPKKISIWLAFPTADL